MSWLNGVRPQLVNWGLTPLLLILFFQQTLAAEPLRIDGSTGVKPLVEALAAGYEIAQSDSRIKIGSGLKPTVRIQALLDGQIDIAMASHGIDVEDISRQGMKVHRFAKMAVVMGVNNSVTIDSLSHQALCDIYSGKVKTWGSLGGTDTSIVPFIRPFDEVDTEVVSAYINCFTKQLISSGIEIRKKSGQMAKSLANTPGAIGMTTQVRVAQSKGKIRALALADMQPDVTNLLSGAYPLTRDSFLITAAAPAPEVEAFLAFIRSEKGRQIIVTNNAVPAD